MPRLKSYRDSQVPNRKQNKMWHDSLEQLMKQKEWEPPDLNTQPVFLPKEQAK